MQPYHFSEIIAELDDFGFWQTLSARPGIFPNLGISLRMWPNGGTT